MPQESKFSAGAAGGPENAPQSSLQNVDSSHADELISPEGVGGVVAGARGMGQSDHISSQED